MTTSMSMQGFSMPASKSMQCIARSQKAVAPEPQDKNCRATDTQVSGNTVTMKMVCTGKDPMEGTGTFTTTGSAMKGRMVMKSGEGEMQMAYTAENTGKPCDAKAAERAVKQIIAQGAAMTDKACMDLANSAGPAAGFFGKSAACKDPKHIAAYCANIKGEKGYALLRQEDAAAKANAQPSLVPEVERACGVSQAAMNKDLCSSAEKRKSWGFLAKQCDVQAKVIAARECAGRGYTAMSASPYKDFCSAYGVEVTSEDAPATGNAAAAKVQAAPAAAEAPKEESKEDSKVKRGLKGLKGALGL
jgi:hypothetical protein